MANSDIKTRLVLQGEKEYSKGMKDAAANVKELDSRLKVVKSEFEKTGDAQKYAAEQAQILKEKIEQQQSAVKAAEDALNYLSQNGFDKNDSRMRSWRISLNNAKSELNRLESQLKKTETATEESTSAVQRQASNMSKAEESAQSYADKLDSIDKGISFSNALTVLKTVKDTISEILSGVIEVGKGIWNYEMQAAQWATEINTKASEAGISPAVYQSYKYAAEMLGMSIDDYIEMSREIEKSLMSEDVEVAEAFNELGVATRNQDGTMRSAFEVLNEVAAAMSTVNTETRKNVLASKLLGEQYNKLNPLITAGGDAWAHYVEEGKDIGTVSEAAFNALQELDDSRIRLSTKFETMKKEAAGQLAPGFTAITEGLTGLLGTFETFIESDKGQQAIEKINGFLTTIGESIGNIDVGNAVDKFFTKFESVDLGNAIDKVSSAVSAFTDGLSWIVENGETVVKWIEKIAAAYAAIKISSEVMQFINYSKGGGGTGTGAGGALVGTGLKIGAAVSAMTTIYENADKISEVPAKVAETTGTTPILEAADAGIAKIIGDEAYIAIYNGLMDFYGLEDRKIDKAPEVSAESAEKIVEAFETVLPDKIAEKLDEVDEVKPVTQEFEGSGTVYTYDVTEKKGFSLFKPVQPSKVETKTEPIVIEEVQKTAEQLAEEAKMLERGLEELRAQKQAEEMEQFLNTFLSNNGKGPTAESQAVIDSVVDNYIANLMAEIEAKTGEIEEAKEEALIEPLSDLDAAVEAAGAAGANAAAAYAAGIESQLWRVNSTVQKIALLTYPRLPNLLGSSTGLVGTGTGNVYIDGQTAGYILSPTVNTQLGIQTFGR